MEWRKSTQCVFNSTLYEENGLILRGKFSLQKALRFCSIATKRFFVNVLRIPDAGIIELLEDLRILKEENCTDITAVKAFYGAISAFSHLQTKLIA